MHMKYIYRIRVLADEARKPEIYYLFNNKNFTMRIYFGENSLNIYSFLYNKTSIKKYYELMPENL